MAKDLFGARSAARKAAEYLAGQSLAVVMISQGWQLWQMLQICARDSARPKHLN